MQAYQNELVSKVSRLEEENIRLKKEKVSMTAFLVDLSHAQALSSEKPFIILIYILVDI